MVLLIYFKIKYYTTTVFSILKIKKCIGVCFFKFDLEKHEMSNAILVDVNIFVDDSLKDS